MKKFALLLLSVALVLSCTCMAAFASAYVITVDPAYDGEEYNAYKIFDVIYTTPSGASDPVYTYSISNASEWWTTVTTPADSTNPNATGNPATDSVFTVDGLTFTKTADTDPNDNGDIYLVTMTNGDSLTSSQKQDIAKTLSEKLYADVAGKTAANAQPAEAANGTASIDVGQDGYYFVTTSLGALCALDTTNTTVTVGDKNSAPTVAKNVDNNGTWDDDTSVCIGEPVDFQIIVTDGDNTDKALTLEDTMPAGSTLVSGSGNNANMRISIERANNGGTETVTLTNNDDVTVTYDANGRDFEIEFSAAFMTDLNAGDKIVILYTGVLTEDAQISGNTNGANGTEAYNDNIVEMTYSAQTDEDSARLYTYEFDMVKVDDDNNVLTGAEFDLYDAETNGNQINVTLIDTDATTGMKTYMITPDAATSDTIEAGLVRFVGLGEGNYYLEETQAPENYNALSERAEMQVGAQNSHVVLTQNNTKWSSGFKVVNHSGSILPSTGGIGTYLFYGIGAILVVGAVVVLVSKKRMHAYGE